MAAEKKSDAEVESVEEFSAELTQAEKTGLINKARETVRAELKKAARAQFMAEQEELFRVEAGIGKTDGGSVKSGDVLAEMVEFTLSIPEGGPAYIQLDMPYKRRYYHNQTCRAPRHIYNELISIAYNLQRLERSIKGEKQWGYREKPFTTISAKTGAMVA